MKTSWYLVATALVSCSTLAAQADLSAKAPTQHTVEKYNELKASLPFNDKRDFEFAKRGFIAKPDQLQIKNAAGDVVWDLSPFAFLDSTKEYASINPSLNRQAKLNMNYGLFEVTEGIYQVRGYDLTNITYVKSDTGWIVFDPLTVPETAKAAHELVTKELGERPIKAIIYSHAHPDHFGGVRGIVTQEQVDSGEVPIIAPLDFMEHVVKESLLAGNAMARRASYQYASMIPTGPRGKVDAALGKGVPLGRVGLIKPTRIVSEPTETITIDGVTMVMQNTPDTESPSEMNTWLPQFKTLWIAENVVAGLHNVYTIRGAQTRDAAGWSKYINRVIHEFGNDAQVMMASHHWPRWGTDVIVDTLEKQRDLYGYIHDQALNMANQGVTISQIHTQFTVPDVLADEWYNKGYHGSYSHNVRGVVNKYLGYYDANPATLNELSPAQAGKKYVELAGGEDALLEKARQSFAKGEYRWSAQLVNHLVFANPENEQARALQADTLEQLGYQAENANWRNAYLSAANELRYGMAMEVNSTQMGIDVARSIDTELLFDYLGVRLNAKRAAGQEFKINIRLPDTEEQFLLELKHSHLNNLKGVQSDKADLTLTINRTDLDNLLLGVSTMEKLIDNDKVQVKGELSTFGRLVGMLDTFDYWFEIIRPNS